MPSDLPTPDWSVLAPGMALWALALYLPLSGPLSRMEEALAAGPLDEQTRQVILVVSSLLLALAVGFLVDLFLCWSLGPGWASSLGLMAVLAGAFWGLAAGSNDR
jgi:protein-S-isoprenylcysteine O-methyltransferase Ste14